MAGEKFVTFDQLGIIKGYIDAKDEKAIKSADYTNNTIKLYTTDNKSGSPAVTINLPEEMYLDQTKTTVVDSFAWSSSLYPNSTNPNLDGKPVLVLAVKGDNTMSYSFASLGNIVQAVTGEATETASLTVTDGKAKADVKISAEANNTLKKKSDGLYVAPAEFSFATNEEVSALFS